MSYATALIRWWVRRPAAARWTCVAAWAGAIWWSSARPSTAAGRSLAGMALHNSAHVLVFGVLGALLALALPGGRDGDGGRMPRRAVAAIVLAAVYGGIDELHQLAVPGRKASLGDLAADVCGAALCVGLICWAWRRPRWSLVLSVVALVLAVVAVAVETLR